MGRQGKRGGRSVKATGPNVWLIGTLMLSAIAVFGAAVLVITAAVTNQLPGFTKTPQSTTLITQPQTPPTINLLTQRLPRTPAADEPRPDLLAPPPQPPAPAFPPSPAPTFPPQNNTRPPAEDGYYLLEKPRDYTPKNNMWSAHMPAGEKSRDLQKLFRVGVHTMPLEGAEVESGTTTYSAASLGIPAVLMRDIPAEDRCDMIWEALYKSKGGKLIGKKQIKQDPCVGKEFLVQLDDSAARVQVYTIAGWVVMGIVEGKDMDAVRVKDADTFLGGITLSADAKKLYRDINGR